MKLDPILSKANRLARRGKYEEAKRTLEPEVNRYRGSFTYYYILGVSCLHTGDFGGALTYFRLAREVKIRDPLAILGLAVLYLRRRETDKAVDLYLDVQEVDEKNRLAKKALKVIRKNSRDDKILSWLDSGRIKSLYPPIPFIGFSWKQIILSAAAVFAVLAVCFAILIKTNVIGSPFAGKTNRIRLSELTLSSEDKNQPVQTAGTYRYILTRSQVVDTYQKALSLFTSYRDEASKININRILESNASEGIKNKSRLLLSYMEIPGFDNFKQADNVSYGDVIKDPLLYRDVYVIWRGMASNVETNQNITRFDLLVGYDTRRTLEGIVQVEFDSAVSLNSERPLEVLGRIVPVSSAAGDIQLAGHAIHQSGILENQ